MRNNLSMLAIFISFLFSNYSLADQVNKCNLEKYELVQKSIVDVLCEPSLGALYLKHDQRKRLIWLETKDHKFFYPLIRLESNADPSLVGEEKSIVFISKSIIRANGRQFIGLTIAERSMRGNGMGQCGAGSEIYFISLELSKIKIMERKRFLVYSCIQSIYLAGDGNKENSSITLNDDQLVIFKWLDYPGYENPVTGSYSFITNLLTVTEDKK